PGRQYTFVSMDGWGRIAPLLWLGVVHAQTGAPPAALVNQYCIYCHNGEVHSGGMTLTKLNVTHPDQTAELAEKVIRKVRAGLMPPPGMPRPNPAALQSFASGLETALDQAAALNPNPRRRALRHAGRNVRRHGAGPRVPRRWGIPSQGGVLLRAHRAAVRRQPGQGTAERSRGEPRARGAAGHQSRDDAGHRRHQDSPGETQ